MKSLIKKEAQNEEKIKDAELISQRLLWVEKKYLNSATEFMLFQNWYWKRPKFGESA